MRRRSILPIFLLALVAACGTPQEQCIRSATRDLRTLDRLIAEAQATLARGYAYESREVIRHEWRRCHSWVAGNPPRMCFEPVWHTVKRPVAIDPAAEQRKLDGLVARRKALAAEVEAAVTACKTEHPE